jgi:hypothetical protein
MATYMQASNKVEHMFVASKIPMSHQSTMGLSRQRRTANLLACPIELCLCCHFCDPRDTVLVHTKRQALQMQCLNVGFKFERAELPLASEGLHYQSSFSKWRIWLRLCPPPKEKKHQEILHRNLKMGKYFIMIYPRM